MIGADHVRSFRHCAVLVVGDVILDRYVTGNAPRISPEAPVPVVHVQEEEVRVGGAANVAANLHSLEAKPKLIGVIGKDEAGRHLKEEVKKSGVGSGLLRMDGNRPTVQKTRILASHQQVLRVDREDVQPLSPEVERRVCEQIAKAGNAVPTIVLSDYGKGVVTPRVIEAACATGAEVLVDPKGRDYRRYRGAHGITPNAKEAERASGVDTSTLDGCRGAARLLLRQGRFEVVIITRGASGIYYRTRRGKEGQVPTRARSVFDVTGAGDTVIAVLALARAAGQSWGDAVEVANAAAGLVVERLGAARLSPAELERALRGGSSSVSKVSHLAGAVVAAEQLRSQGRKVVLTNGCFDLLHAGHVESLEFCRAQGEFLMVAVNDDQSVRRQKGSLRPVQSLESRMRVLAGLAAVDLVFSFGEDTPEKVVRQVSPDILVKGEDWKDKGVVGREWVESRGGRVVLVPLLSNHSTTRIIEHIQAHSAGR